MSHSSMCGCCGLRSPSHVVLWTFSQASAALARKKGKGLHEDVAIFWHKKKISEFPVALSQSLMLCVQGTWSFEWAPFPRPRGPPCASCVSVSLGTFMTSVAIIRILLSQKEGKEIQC